MKFRTNYTQTYTTTQRKIMPQNNQVEILLEPLYLKKQGSGYDSTGVLRYKSNGLYYHGVRPDEKEAKKGCGSFWGYGWDDENCKPAPGSPPNIKNKKWDFHIQEWCVWLDDHYTYTGRECNNFCSNCSHVKDNPKSIQFRCMGHKKEEVEPSLYARASYGLPGTKSRITREKKIQRWKEIGAYWEWMDGFVLPYNVESKNVPEKDGHNLEKAPRDFNNNAEESSSLGEIESINESEEENDSTQTLEPVKRRSSRIRNKPIRLIDQIQPRADYEQWAKSIPQRTKEAVIRRDKNKCKSCGRTNLKNPEIDHIKPKSVWIEECCENHKRTGEKLSKRVFKKKVHGMTNLQTLCTDCHKCKTKKDIARLKILRESR